MVVCDACGIEPSAYEQHTIPPLIESLDPERRMILSSFYGAGETPSALCAACFNTQVGEVNRLFAVAITETASTAPMESRAETTREKEETDAR